MGGARFPSREVKTGSEEYFGVPCPAVFVPTNRWSPEFTKRFGGLGNHFVGVVDLSGTSWTQSFFFFLVKSNLVVVLGRFFVYRRYEGSTDNDNNGCC